MKLPIVVLLGAVAAALFVGTLMLANLGGRSLRRAFRFTRLALRPLRSLGELDSGPCRIQGFAMAAAETPALVSPLSARPVVLFVLEIACEGRLLVTEKKSLPALLRGESGEIELDLASAELELETTRNWRGTLAHELPPGIDAALRARLVGAATAATSKTQIAKDVAVLDLAEHAVHVGQALHVCGTVVRMGPKTSFLSTEPVVISDRAFADMARRDGMFAAICVAVALAVAGALSAVGGAILSRVTT